MKKPINAKKMLEEIILALEENPEGDRLKRCPQCYKMHVVQHQGQDFCGPQCVDDYNNQKKKLNRMCGGGPVKYLPEVFEKFQFDDDLFPSPTIQEMADENDKLLDHVELLIKQNKSLISERDATRLDRDLTVKQKNSELAERDATIAKQLASEKSKDAIINQQSLKLQEFEKLSDAGKKDFILWCLVAGAIKVALLQSKGAIFDSWNGRATLYGFKFVKKYMRDEYVLSPGQNFN